MCCLERTIGVQLSGRWSLTFAQFVLLTPFPDPIMSLEDIRGGTQRAWDGGGRRCIRWHEQSVAYWEQVATATDRQLSPKLSLPAPKARHPEPTHSQVDRSRK